MITCRKILQKIILYVKIAMKGSDLTMFAERIKKLRKEAGITQAELGKICGLSKGTVAMWEVGQREVTFDTLRKLADYFGVTADYLLGFSDETSPAAHEAELVDFMLGPDPAKMKQAMDNFFYLEEFGIRNVMAVVNNEYKRCLEQGTLKEK